LKVGRDVIQGGSQVGDGDRISRGGSEGGASPPHPREEHRGVACGGERRGSPGTRGGYRSGNPCRPFQCSDAPLSLLGLCGLCRSHIPEALGYRSRGGAPRPCFIPAASFGRRIDARRPQPCGLLRGPETHNNRHAPTPKPNPPQRQTPSLSSWGSGAPGRSQRHAAAGPTG